MVPKWEWDPEHGQLRIWLEEEGRWMLYDGTRLERDDSATIQEDNNSDRSNDDERGLQTDHDSQERLDRGRSRAELGQGRLGHAKPQAPSLLSSSMHEDWVPMDRDRTTFSGVDGDLTLNGVGAHFHPPGGKYTYHGKDAWKVGLVFKMLFVKPNGSNYYAEKELLVVLQLSSNACFCAVIEPYNRHGPAIQTIQGAHLAVIHTSKRPPALSAEELRHYGKAKMLPPIRVNVKDATTLLTAASRINYEKIVTVEFNCSIRVVGYVHEKSMPSLMNSFKSIGLPLTQQSAAIESGFESTDHTVPGHSLKIANGPSEDDASEMIRIRTIVHHWAAAWTATGILENSARAQWLLTADYESQKRFLRENGAI